MKNQFEKHINFILIFIIFYAKHDTFSHCEPAKTFINLSSVVLVENALYGTVINFGVCELPQCFECDFLKYSSRYWGNYECNRVISPSR